VLAILTIVDTTMYRDTKSIAILLSILQEEEEEEEFIGKTF